MKASPSLLLFLLLVAATAGAQDGLYAPSPAEDAALVRVINAGSSAVSVDVGSLQFREVEPGSGTSYRPVRPGIYVVAHAGAREVVEPAARSFVSIVLRSDGLTVLRDEHHTDPARAQLVLYNVSDLPVEFRAISPETTLVPDVASMSSGVRVANAIPVVVGVAFEEMILYEAELDLRRGKSYALVFRGRNAEPAGFVVRASVESE